MNPWEIYRLVLLAVVAGCPFHGSILTIRGANAGCLDQLGWCNSKNKNEDDKDVISGGAPEGNQAKKTDKGNDGKTTTDNAKETGGGTDNSSANKSGLKLYTNDGTNEKELDANSYKEVKLSNQTNYTLNSGVKCSKVTYDGKEVWKHDGSSNDYPVGIICYTKDNDFSIIFEKKFITCKKNGDQWNKEVTDIKSSVTS